MTRWWALAFAVLPAAAWSQAGDITYKGVPLGAPLAHYKATLPDHECSESTGLCRYSLSNNCYHVNDRRALTVTSAEMRKRPVIPVIAGMVGR